MLYLVQTALNVWTFAVHSAVGYSALSCSLPSFAILNDYFYFFVLES